MKDIKWVRNVATSILFGSFTVFSHPERCRIGLAVAVGWFVFGCLVDFLIAKFLPKRRPRRVGKMKCNICQYHDSAMCFYFLWHTGNPGPEPAVNPQLKCPKCGSNDLEEVNG